LPLILKKLQEITQKLSLPPHDTGQLGVHEFSPILPPIRTDQTGLPHISSFPDRDAQLNKAMTLTRKNRPTGFTLIEATVVLACIAILGTIWAINIRRAKGISTRIKCVSNLKIAALSLKIYASDHNDHYAWQVEPDISFSTPLATMNLADRTTNSIADCAAWAQWGCLSNELGSPKILLCSGNRLKKNSIATDWSTSEFRGFFAKRGFDRMDHGMDLISEIRCALDYRSFRGPLFKTFLLCRAVSRATTVGMVWKATSRWRTAACSRSPVSNYARASVSPPMQLAHPQ
jgi:type II secretory pathway pseudopilin PulG